MNLKRISGEQRIAILSDLQIPFQDQSAIDLAIAHCREFRPSVVLLNGDIVDFYAISRFERDPDVVDLADEVSQTKDFLSSVRKAFRNATVIWKDGNHEERWVRFLSQEAAVLRGFECLRLPDLLDFRKFRVEYVSNKIPIVAGHLAILHGHEYKGGGGGAHPAKWLISRTKGSALCGHFHRSGSQLERTIRGDLIGAWTTGCLCDLSPEWMPLNQWNHGFATVLLRKNGEFVVDNFSITKGKVFHA